MPVVLSPAPLPCREGILLRAACLFLKDISSCHGYQVNCGLELPRKKPNTEEKERSVRSSQKQQRTVCFHGEYATIRRRPLKRNARTQDMASTDREKERAPLLEVSVFVKLRPVSNLQYKLP